VGARARWKYTVPRHPKKATLEETVASDVLRECERRKLPKPEAIRVTSVRGVAGVGVEARVELAPAVAVRGPLLLGKTRYLGGGLFRPVLGSIDGAPMRDSERAV